MAKLAEVRAVGIRAAVEVEPLWGVPETASYLGVPESTVYRWCSRGGSGPRSYRVGRYRRFKPDEVRAWLNTRASEPAA